MATASNMDQLSKYLECSLCLSTFHNPKQLTCHHQFCKTCLDDLLEFNADGSAYITCPVRCDEKTFISDEQTTNDLDTVYEFKGILEMFKVNNDSLVKPLCAYKERCCKDVSIYCPLCGFMCKKCVAIHDTDHIDHGGTKTSVIFDDNEGRLKILCKQHATFCSVICHDGKLVCIYCMQRNYKGYPHYPLEKQSAGIREAVSSELGKIEMITDNIAAVISHINLCKEKLEMSLSKRKIMCMLKYFEYLSKEEEIMKNKFHNIFTEYVQKYRDYDGRTKTMDYYKEILKKQDIELVMLNNSIREIVKECRVMSLQSVTVSLGNIDIRSEHPLGDLQVVTGDFPIADINKKSTFNLNINEYDHGEDGCNFLNLHRDLEELLQEVNVQTSVVKQECKSFTGVKRPSNIPVLNPLSHTKKRVEEPRDVVEHIVKQSTILVNDSKKCVKSLQSTRIPVTTEVKKYGSLIQRSRLDNSIPFTIDVEKPQYRSCVRDVNKESTILVSYARKCVEELHRKNVEFYIPVSSDVTRHDKQTRNIIAGSSGAGSIGQEQHIQDVVTEKEKALLSDCLKRLDNPTGGEINYITQLIQANQIDTLCLLLRERPNIIKMRDYHKCTPLLIAAGGNKLLITKVLLLQYGSSVDEKNRYGGTVLHTASSNDSAACVRWIVIIYPCLINQKDLYGDSALHYAARYRSLNSLKVLINYGADITMKNSEGLTPLDTAKQFGRGVCEKEIQKVMAEKGWTDNGKYAGKSVW